jgi:hypothetical protein
VLNLFASVFGISKDDDPELPATLIKQLTERAVDGTDPRMRLISGYAKELKKPIAHAAEYLIGLIDRLPEPLPLVPGALRNTPVLAAFLYSEEKALQLLQRDPALLEYRASKPPATQAITALLVVQQDEKHSFGYGQVGDQTLTEVAQTTINFSKHRLLEPASDETTTRRGLKRRAFDQVLALALTTITERKEQRTELASMRALLRSKLEIIQRSGSFAIHTDATEQTRLQAKMTDIEQQLAALGPGTDELEGNLETVVGVLENAERHLWIEETTLYLDQFYVLHDKPDQSAPPIVCWNIHNSKGRQATLQLVRLPTA